MLVQWSTNHVLSYQAIPELVIMRVDYKTVDHGDRSIYMTLIHESGVFELQNEMKFQ